MNKPTAIPLSAFIGESRVTSNGGVNYRTCPICRSDNWKVYADLRKMVWMCFAGDHSAGGKLIGQAESTDETLLESMRQLDATGSFDLHIEEEENRSVSLPSLRGELESGDIIILRHRYHLRSPAVFGLTRGTETEKIEPGQYYMPVSRFYIPYYDDEGRVIYYSGRRIFDGLYGDANVHKYRNCLGARRLYVPMNCPVVKNSRNRSNGILFIVEGPFDAMRIVEEGFDAVALGGKLLPNSVKKDLLTISEKYDIIVVLLDLDASADAFNLWQTLGNIFPPTTQIRLGQLSGKDAASLMPGVLIKELLELSKDTVLDIANQEGVKIEP